MVLELVSYVVDACGGESLKKSERYFNIAFWSVSLDREKNKGGGKEVPRNIFVHYQRCVSLSGVMNSGEEDAETLSDWSSRTT